MVFFPEFRKHRKNRVKTIEYKDRNIMKKRSIVSLPYFKLRAQSNYFI